MKRLVASLVFVAVLALIALPSAAAAQGADQQLVPQQVLQQSLGPAEELMPRMHAERSVDIEHERLELQWIRERGIFTADCRGSHFAWRLG